MLDQTSSTNELLRFTSGYGCGDFSCCVGKRKNIVFQQYLRTSLTNPAHVCNYYNLACRQCSMKVFIKSGCFRSAKKKTLKNVKAAKKVSLPSTTVRYYSVLVNFFNQNSQALRLAKTSAHKKNLQKRSNLIALKNRNNECCSVQYILLE